ncbi:MAG: single-stranded DNA-binding protein [Sphaerochaetaceae bacterium]|jgi:single-strand DNA-binding protein|nr:single-stranded DNA-binding protein [Spirochaetales bacterium]
MANDTNIVVLIGRLTRDSELKYTSGGTAVSRFSIAVNRMKRSGDQREEEVSFFDIVVWGKFAEVLNPYLTRGKQVCVEGELRQSRWEQDGQSRSRVEVVARNLQLLGGGPSSDVDMPSDNRSRERNSSQTASPMQGFPGPEQFDDDIPF